MYRWANAQFLAHSGWTTGDQPRLYDTDTIGPSITGLDVCSDFDAILAQMPRLGTIYSERDIAEDGVWYLQVIEATPEDLAMRRPCRWVTIAELHLGGDIVWLLPGDAPDEFTNACESAIYKHAEHCGFLDA